MKPRSLVTAIIILFIILAINLACVVPFLRAPVPTTPATKDDSASPTATSIKTPPVSQTAAATPVPVETQTKSNEQVALDVMARLGLPTDTGRFALYHPSFTIDLADQPVAMYKPFNPDIIPDLVASDFVISSDITWISNDKSGCGLWFRTDESWGKGDYYAVSIGLISDHLTSLGVDYTHNGTFNRMLTGLGGYAYSLNENGASNQITLSAVRNEFRFFINGDLEGVYHDYSKKLTSGRFAFNAWQNSGSTICVFKNTWVWVYK
jgi:hypothetical protein